MGALQMEDEAESAGEPRSRFEAGYSQTTTSQALTLLSKEARRYRMEASVAPPRVGNNECGSMQRSLARLLPIWARRSHLKERLCRLRFGMGWAGSPALPPAPS